MEKYNCPVCDRAMKGRHYCSFCRQYVKNPYVSKAKYYLNVRHSSFEEDCDYHGKTASHGQMERVLEKVRIASEAAFGEAPGSAQRQMNRNEQMRNKNSAHGSQMYISQTKRNQAGNTKKSSPGLNNVLTAIFLLVALINIMGSCITNY